jgi:DNA-binding response OmpR family regulator
MSQGVPAIIIEDDYTAADIAARQLEAIGFATSTAYTGGEGLELAYEKQPALVIIDERLPDMSGIEILQQLRSQLPEATFVISTVVDDETIIKKAFKAGCNYYVIKPSLRILCAQRNSPEKLLNASTTEILSGDRFSTFRSS